MDKYVQLCMMYRGKPSAKHIVKSDERGLWLYSYERLVAHLPHNMGCAIIFKGYDMSVTTLKYVKLFIGERSKYRTVMDKVDGIFVDTHIPVVLDGSTVSGCSSAGNR